MGMRVLDFSSKCCSGLLKAELNIGLQPLLYIFEFILKYMVMYSKPPRQVQNVDFASLSPVSILASLTYTLLLKPENLYFDIHENIF